jgi:hypothetical protein
MKTVS